MWHCPNTWQPGWPTRSAGLANECSRSLMPRQSVRKQLLMDCRKRRPSGRWRCSSLGQQKVLCQILCLATHRKLQLPGSFYMLPVLLLLLLRTSCKQHRLPCSGLLTGAAMQLAVSLQHGMSRSAYVFTLAITKRAMFAMAATLHPVFSCCCRCHFLQCCNLRMGFLVSKLNHWASVSHPCTVPHLSASRRSYVGTMCAG